MYITMMKKVVMVIIILLFCVLSCDNNPVNPDDKEVTIPDAAVETAMLEAIGKSNGPVTESELKKITNLVIHGYPRVLDGIDHCVNLKSLKIGQSDISDLGPIQDLGSLISIHINLSRVKDVSFFKKLHSLRDLDLSFNEIEDISPIVNLDSLKFLALAYNQIHDLPNLSNMTQLQFLYLDYNSITSFEPFLVLPNIKILHLWNNSIEDLSTIYSATWLNSESDITIDLDSNPLNENSINSIIPDLRSNYEIRVYY